MKVVEDGYCVPGAAAMVARANVARFMLTCVDNQQYNRKQLAIGIWISSSEKILLIKAVQFRKCTLDTVSCKPIFEIKKIILYELLTLYTSMYLKKRVLINDL